MPRALKAKLARETDKKAVLCTSTLLVHTPLLIAFYLFFSTRSREMAPNVSNKGSPSCRRVSDQKKLFAPHRSSY
jgi:hypothetical protein